MAFTQITTRTTAIIGPAAQITPLVVLGSPLRAMKAYVSWCRIARLDAAALQDVGLTAAERDAITYAEVFATS